MVPTPPSPNSNTANLWFQHRSTKSPCGSNYARSLLTATTQPQPLLPPPTYGSNNVSTNSLPDPIPPNISNLHPVPICFQQPSSGPTPFLSLSDSTLFQSDESTPTSSPVFRFSPKESSHLLSHVIRPPTNFEPRHGTKTTSSSSNLLNRIPFQFPATTMLTYYASSQATQQPTCLSHLSPNNQLNNQDLLHFRG
jgi:hypothetical protein